MVKHNPYFNTYNCVFRLYQQYKQHKSLIIAFDFDDTVFDFHNQGFYFNKTFNILKECKRMGFKLLLFTSKQESEYEKIQEYLKEHEIIVDYINESPVMNTKKPYYNLLLDDKAGLGQAYNVLEKLIIKIRTKEL